MSEYVRLPLYDDVSHEEVGTAEVSLYLLTRVMSEFQFYNSVRVNRFPTNCIDCKRPMGCNANCEDMNCEHCYCGRDGRDG